MTTHGGKRPNTGPKPPNIDLNRVKARLARGYTQQAIADDFGVQRHQITYITAKLRSDARRRVVA